MQQPVSCARLRADGDMLSLLHNLTTRYGLTTI